MAALFRTLSTTYLRAQRRVAPLQPRAIRIGHGPLAAPARPASALSPKFQDSGVFTSKRRYPVSLILALFSFDLEPQCSHRPAIPEAGWRPAGPRPASRLAKGLEFRAVVVMACDEGVLPLDERVADAADEAELDDIYETERRLLYVACTRAREHLLITGVTPTSEYLADFTS
jgi:UvrD-like helicase family protein